MSVISALKSKSVLASAALLATMSAQATPISNASIAGQSIVYLETAPGSGIVAPNPYSVANLNSALSGAGNAELGKFGIAQATLSGNFFGHAVTLSSLSKNDWTNNGNALATSYITGAATSIGATLSAAQMANALNVFLNVDLDPSAKTFYSWQYVSDPNISDVNFIDKSIVVGLDGLLDGSTFLNSLFKPFGVTAPAGSTASEVVKLVYENKTHYLYGFSATSTGYHTNDGTRSYTGRFEVSAAVPEPATLAIFGLGFAAMGFISRRKNS